MLVFLDIETTGSGDERGVPNESVLEVAALVTTDDLEVLGMTQELVKPVGSPLPGFDMDKIEPVVREMHAKNGLFEAVEREGLRRYEAETSLVGWFASFLEKNGGEKLTLVGNSVWFDLVFLREHMPELARCFSRRVVDLTSVNQLVARWNVDVFNNRPRSESNHRALSDCQAAADLLRYYRENGLFLSMPID